MRRKIGSRSLTSLGYASLRASLALAGAFSADAAKNRLAIPYFARLRLAARFACARWRVFRRCREKSARDPLPRSADASLRASLAAS
jgi:hypothetical protein